VDVCGYGTDFAYPTPSQHPPTPPPPTPQTQPKVLPEPLHAAVVELAPYLIDSFGNATRIDYGTGHETTFAALLYCLAALGVVGEDDRVALVNTVFEK